MNIDLYAGENSLDIELSGLIVRSTATYINDATVTCRILDVNDAEITGITQPITMSYVAASNGDYSAVIDHASDIVVDTRYKVVVLVISGANRAEFTYEAIAKVRPFL